MKRTLTQSEIIDLLLNDPYAKWSVDGAKALAEWYEELESNYTEEIEFDRVAIRCQWSEFNSLKEIREQYETAKNKNYTDSQFLEWLNDQTTILKLTQNRYLVGEF
jgi:hypothetical protein